jgi:hypothetical protein
MGLFGYPHLCLKCGDEFTIYNRGMTVEEQEEERKK